MEKSKQMHLKWKGKLEVVPKVPLDTKEDLAIAYTPGVAEPCKAISKNKKYAYDYTMKGNTVAVVSNGTAVLGLGNIGPEAALPVMEGKAALFKSFANVNAVPLCIDAKDTESIITFVKQIAPTFGGINLEDIAAPECFEIERRLQEMLDIPVFHDDQHGTAIVVLAALINSLKIVEKKKENVRLVINGAGAAGIAITNLLHREGFRHIIVVDKKGILHKDEKWINEAQRALLAKVNHQQLKGGLLEAIKGADIFIGVSAGGALTEEMVSLMNEKSIVFALANPEPEIMPDSAKKAGAMIVATGRSDFPNQVNNVLAFPGIFKGALEGRARQITEKMKCASAYAIADMVPKEKLKADYILPEAFSKTVAERVAKAVIESIDKEEKE